MTTQNSVARLQMSKKLQLAQGCLGSGSYVLLNLLALVWFLSRTVPYIPPTGSRLGAFLYGILDSCTEDEAILMVFF